MSKLAQACLVAGLAAAGTAAAQNDAPSGDRYAWLEDVTGDKPLDWVKARNAQTESTLAATPRFKAMEADIRAILDSDAKIPGVQKIGAYYYNFWKDKQHERGLWRRTTLEEYRKPQPRWETVLDLDALNKAEGHQLGLARRRLPAPGLSALPDRAFARWLGRDVTREFDLAARPSSKAASSARSQGRAGLDRREHRVRLHRFRRGLADRIGLSAHRQAMDARHAAGLGHHRVRRWPGDMYIAAMHDDTPGYERDFVSRTLAFYNDELYLRGKDGALSKIDVPNSAQKSVFRQWLGLELREPWTVAGTTYPAGAFIVTDFDAFMAGKRDFDVLFRPDAHTSLAGVTLTKNHVVLNILDDVKNRLSVLSHGPKGWLRSRSRWAPATSAPPAWAPWTRTTATAVGHHHRLPHPTTLLMGDAGKPAAPLQAIKAMPAFFDAGNEGPSSTSPPPRTAPACRTSSCGPRTFDGKAPTLLYGYGGFEISLTPNYSGSIGKGWLTGPDGKAGGVYVVANIRGGGEYGPRWHQAALKANRHKAYEDMAAVAQDLVERKITSPAHLGVMGGSNGGLLAGNMLVQYPQLFGAVVVQVPLLDMKRYSHLLAGASWMAEYGDPDTADWDFIKTFSRTSCSMRRRTTRRCSSSPRPATTACTRPRPQDGRADARCRQGRDLLREHRRRPRRRGRQRPGRAHGCTGLQLPVGAVEGLMPDTAASFGAASLFASSPSAAIRVQQ
jgi:prolyl oligopeptidase